MLGGIGSSLRVETEKEVEKPAQNEYNVRVGTWRSLVAYLNGVQVVASSNLAVPTITLPRLHEPLPIARSSVMASVEWLSARVAGDPTLVREIT